MSRSIYATFTTERDAERAAGALLDHGVPAQAVSFVISEAAAGVTESDIDRKPLLRTAEPVDAVPPPTSALPGTFANRPVGSEATARPVYSSDLESSPSEAIASPNSPYQSPDAVRSVPLTAPMVATVMPPNTPQDVVEHESRAHIIDMESDRPNAADGISTTTAGDAAKGAAGGAGIGVGLGILLGLAAVLIPGVGLVAGAGALVAGLAAATGVAGGIAGGVYGYLADLGIPQEHAKLIGDHLTNGGVVLHVEMLDGPSEVDVMGILTKYGATSAQGF